MSWRNTKVNTLNAILRPAFLLLFLVSIIVAVWHLSWLHDRDRYQLQVTDRNEVFVIDRQQGIVYAGLGFFDDAKPTQWHKSQLPNTP
jgi:hypothetical protein